MEVKSEKPEYRPKQDILLSFRNLISKNIAQLSSINYANPQLESALQQLSERKFKNEKEARDQFPFETFSDLIWTNGSILHELSNLTNHIESMNESFSSFSGLIDSYDSQWNSKSKAALELYNKYQAFEAEEKRIYEKLNGIEYFENNFLISDEDLIHLTSHNDVDDRFYSILEKAQSIHDNTNSLFTPVSEFLNYESLEGIIKTMSKHIDTAYGKLYRFVELELRNPRVIQTMETNPDIKRAITKLLSENTMSSRTINLIIQVRQQNLHSAYVTALTRGDSLSSSKPIELSAPDSLRFIGDLLAWIHQTIVNEKELIDSIFASRRQQVNSHPMPPWDLPSTVQEQANNLLDGSLYGICRPLLSRAQTSILDLTDTIRLYNLVELLGFYHEAFSKIIHENCIVLKILKTTEDFTYQRMKTVIDDELYAISSSLPKVTDDLLPPDFVTNFLRNANSIFKIRNASLSAAGVDELQFIAIFSDLFEKVFQICLTMVPNRLLNHRDIIYLLNILDSCLTYLRRYNFLTPIRDSFESYINTYVEKLVDLVYQTYLTESGLSDLINLIKNKDDEEELKAIFLSIPWDQQVSRFSSFVTITISEIIADFQLLAAPLIMENVMKSTAEKFIQSFQQFTQKVQPIVGYVWPLSIEELKIAMNVDSTLDF
ncbi:transport complex peripheral subunit Cog6 [Schizosaccharomyces cryophilus OY26]|uniref:Conserved oligomeric Golgi complex subunit 6 n=1 Tax=Schizosaccharomyces cryophilus (strain OY26 / ATCC MYA-4695 / CBS 11777 / NBRC 106824 / NRRL Y48691) TaxID=653667 RepID=S9W639_SCHCR|nr:transport complex peripheral subunit Cog6 [Schizosaccharomyces cryophilus OY26]EPY54029.1 transport complex peripheral subunit Cog6 [Schizosaccharomyces cryophilus OY26]